MDEVALHDYLDENLGPEASPEFIQIAETLPRRPDGSFRTDLLQLIPYNQLEDIERERQHDILHTSSQSPLQAAPVRRQVLVQVPQGPVDVAPLSGLTRYRPRLAGRY